MLTTDFLFEGVRFLILLVLVGYLWKASKSKNFSETAGWKFIQYGFALILFGAFLDITDNFDGLNRFVVVGDTQTEAFLEKVVGYLGGFVLITYGVFRWGPEIGRMMAEVSAHRRAETALQDSLGELQDRTNALTTELDDRGEAETALIKTESTSRALLEGSPVCNKIIDLDSRLLYMSQAGIDMLKIADIGKHYGTIYPPEFYDESVRAPLVEHLELAKSGKITDVECPLYSTEGDEVWLHTTFVPARNPDGEVEYVIATSVDITERRSMADQLQQALKMEAVGQLTGGVAHDFNNLLGVIIGNLDFLEETLAEDADQHELIETALRAALKGAELTNRLLAFSRKQPLHPVVVDLNDLIHDMTDLLKRTLGETVSIRTAAAADLELVKVDSGQLETVLLNLALNALHAMPDGGQLTIETGTVELDREYTEGIPEVEPGTFAMLAVSDTGVGIPSDIKDHVFDPFFTTKEVGQGSGLGLSMVYGFVKQSDGHISIYSEVGEGTTVKLYFPATEAEAVSTKQNSIQQDVPRGAGESVLIVEDDASLRELAVKTVSGLGYQAVTAPDGPSALSVLDEGVPVDVLFTDVVLPRGMNGIALASAALERRSDLRVLYTSGYTENAIVNKGVFDEEIELLDKPYRRSDLARRLQQVLAR